MAKAAPLPYEAPDTPGPYSVELHNTAGGSDKIYRLSIEPSGDLWLVNYANGRRGSTLATGTKTSSPVAYEAARKICNSKLNEQVGKAYLPIGGSHFGDGMAVEAIATAARTSSGQVPQLLNPIAIDDVARLVADDEYVAQEKYDGERRFVIVADGVCHGGNRKGQTVALPAAIAEEAVKLAKSVVLDGEQVGDVFYVWDVLSMNGEDLRKDKLWHRLAALQILEPRFGTAIRPVTTAVTSKDKQMLLDRVAAAGGEGVVFKRFDAVYEPGRPASGGAWLKHKFWNTLSAVVGRVNDQRSVGLELLDQSGQRVSVGNVTIPVNKAVPSVGDVVEVRYLYAYDGGALFQPTYLAKRTDVVAEECRLDQRVIKVEVPAEDELPSPGL